VDSMANCAWYIQDPRFSVLCQTRETERKTVGSLILAVDGATLLSVPFSSVILGQAEDQSPESGESLGRKVGVSMVTADLGLVSMIRQGILALQLLPSNSSAGQ
jgi:hypothetical protein